MDQLSLESAFPPGSKIEMEFINETKIIEKHSTRIEGIEGEYLVLYSPLSGGEPVKVLEGQEITLRRFVEQADRVYVTNVFVIENKPGKLPLLICGKPQRISKTSLRRFSRFTVDLPFQCSLQHFPLTGRVVDISLSGCSIITEGRFPLCRGTLLNLRIFLPQDNDLELMGEVVRSREIPGSDHPSVAIAFRKLSEGMQEALINFLFQCQLLNKGIFSFKPGGKPVN